jgi:acetylornithine deacetylase/succinyl-diaminopimelate desuccinylase-like protein
VQKSTIDRHLKNLFELLSIPSISAQSEHKKDMLSAANWLQKKLASLGFNSKVLPTQGHPVVYAEHLTPHTAKPLPTVLIYGHYDVQSPDPLEEWTTDPFKPEIRAENIYGRGTADDKGQLYTWIAAIEELLSQSGKTNKDHSSGGGLPVNIKFLVEGEEEVGSVNIDEFIAENTSLLKSDICVISDSHALSESQPLIDYGLRGLVYAELKIKSLAKDVHSGTYGGNIHNPANVLSEVVAQLKNKDHKVLIPGFYDSVRKLTDKERKELAKFPFGEKEILSETGAKAVAGEDGFTVHERAGARPTLDINGIWSGYTGEGPKTIIPQSACAKVSMRLVPHQTSDEIVQKFRNYLENIIPHGVDWDIEILSTGEPILIDISSDYFKSAQKAFEKIFGNKPLYQLAGGSIPVTATFKKYLNIDSILMGYGLPDDGLHSPNEKLSLSMFEKGIRTNMEFIKNL